MLNNSIFSNPEETIYYPNGAKSQIYIHEDTALIIDDNICNNSNVLVEYSKITSKQNFYMHKYKNVYRFLKEDVCDIDVSKLFTNSENKFENSIFKKNHSTNREDFPDSSPLEHEFEKQFIALYGEDATKFLNKEFAISDENGHTYHLDYLISTTDGDIAIEENGINYHHPQIIGFERYKKQLAKQNLCTKWNIKLYRFSTEDCAFSERMIEDLKRYVGQDTKKFINNGLLVNRKIKLYEHQKVSLEDIKEARKNKIKTFLILLPTASGKSKIVEEDLEYFASSKNRVAGNTASSKGKSRGSVSSQNRDLIIAESSLNAKSDFSALILAPNTNIVSDWQNRIEQNLPYLKDKILIKTYSYLSKHYKEFSQNHFDYIVADEAHHAVAPTYKRVIQYFTPEFLIGLTATDERLDKKRLEDIFGSYKTQLSLQEAMEKKIIAQAYVYRIETNIDLSKVRFNGKDYVNADLEKSIKVTSRNELIAKVLSEYFESDESQGLVFCVNTDHAKEMAKILNAYNISASSYTSKDSNAEKIMQDFKNKKMRFLCTCNMISEGWDYPSLKIIVMARPTLSKVMYLQQIGRGLRKTSTKENVFIIDVVDEYGALLNPCTMHSIFKNPNYVPFGLITKTDYKTGEVITIDGLNEEVIKITPVNIEDFSEKYKDFLSVEQVAREYFVSTETINQWIKKNKLTPDANFDFGTKKIYLFSPQNIADSRTRLKIPVHDETTIYKDFFDFLSEKDYTLSYKMPFLLSLLKNLDITGQAKIDDVLADYMKFYKNRINHNLPVDKKTCPYNEQTLSNTKFVKENMLSNPFEKFERKRFLYLSKDLGLLAINPYLFEKLFNDDYKKIKNQIYNDLKNYYEPLGGLVSSDTLVQFAKPVEYVIPPVEDTSLMVADSGKEK